MKAVQPVTIVPSFVSQKIHGFIPATQRAATKLGV
jgi:hypothetical protein